MMTLKLSQDKRLQLTSSTELYKGENKFERIKILLPLTVCGQDISEYSIALHVANADTKDYFSYILTKEAAKDGYIALVDVGIDLTDQEQTLNLALYLQHGDIVGITNAVTVSVSEAITEETEITPRSELLRRLADCEADISEKTALIATLNAQIEELQGEVSTLTNENAELTGTVRSLTETIESLQGQVSALTAEKEAVEQQIATLDVASASIETVLQGGSIT